MRDLNYAFWKPLIESMLLREEQAIMAAGGNVSNLHVHREVKQVCEQVTTYTFTLSEQDANDLEAALAWSAPAFASCYPTGDFIRRIRTALDKAGISRAK